MNTEHQPQDIEHKHTKNILKKILLFTIHFILLLGLIIPIILQYIYKWNLTFKIYNHIISISLYGFYLFTYLTIQFIFSFINNSIKYRKKNYNYINNNKYEKSVNIIVAGYQENEEYFKSCLISIKNIYENSNIINKVYIMIDGNDSEDQYMIDIFENIFYKTSNTDNLDKSLFLINLDKYDNKYEDLIPYMEKTINNNIICISQKHNGKRSVMYTGFQFSFLENKIYNKNIQTIFCTDSDTIITEECIQEMLNGFTNPNIGAITGNLSIYNKYDSIVSFLSSIRYWYAFNLERAYQSFNGYVMCVSGPIGMYKISSLEKVYEEWNNQTFLKKKCTYGDDRHLTNKILSLGQKINYIPTAHAETETPYSIYRFYKQQIRWNKSSFREFFWTIPLIHYHSVFISIDLIYTLLYPYIVSGYLLYILWNGNLLELSIYFTIILCIGLIKSIYSIIISKNFEHIFYSLYSFIYITIVFPAKLWALININDNSWGTSHRKIISYNVGLDLLILILWNLSLLSGLIYCILHNYNQTNNLYLVIITSIWILLFCLMYIYIKIKKLNNQSNKTNKIKNI
jgi:hyaluronan synthase